MYGATESCGMLQLYFIVMFSVEFVALMLNIESFDRCRGTGTFI